MQKFLTYWFVACAAVLVIPSALIAISTLFFMNEAMIDASGAIFFAMATFFTTALAIGVIGFWPALIALGIGVAICLVNSSKL
jgi:hypothetical protein